MSESTPQMNWRLALTFAALAWALMLGGCGSAYQSLQMRANTVMPSGSVSKRLYSGGQETTVDVVGTFEGGMGSGSQPITGQARIGDTNFPPPDTAATKFSFTIQDASLRWRHFFGGGPVGVEGATGVGFVRFHFQASTATAQGSEAASSAAFPLSFGIIGRINPKTQIETKGTVVGTGSNLSGVGCFQLTLARSLTPHLAIGGGYSMWRVNSPSAVRSTVFGEFSGPAVRVGVTF